jgi:hypothetical protein
MQLPLYGWTIHRFTDLATVREDQRDGPSSVAPSWR